MAEKGKGRNMNKADEQIKKNKEEDEEQEEIE